MNATSHTSTAPVPGPARGALLTREYVQAVGRMADIWGWPLADGSRHEIACWQPLAPSVRLTGNVSPGQGEMACPNRGSEDGFDVSLLDMDQDQDFGDHFWVFPLYDPCSPLGDSANASTRPDGGL